MLSTLLQKSQPIIGLSPMDGVTDAAFRFVTKKYGNPDVTYTEFVHVMGMCRGSERLYQDFIFTDLERPIIGQIFGAEPEYFYHAAKLICELGFDGVDINMGCPAKSVAEHGAGAALIRTPDLAADIIKATQQGVVDWAADGELTGVSDEIKQRIARMVEQRRQRNLVLGVAFKRYGAGAERGTVPVSVKTRIGYDEIVVEQWIAHIAEQKPHWIAVHGRTLKQLYTGQANWDALALAVKATDLPVLVNGDIKTQDDLSRVLELTNARGALIGRGTYGTPWWFNRENKPNPQKIIEIMLEHAQLHVELKGESSYVQLRKHLAWYSQHLPNSVEIRKRLVTSNNIDELQQILSSYQHDINVAQIDFPAALA